MKKPVAAIAIVVFAIIGLILVVESCYVLREGEQAVITEFGEPVGDKDITEAGLHFKMPFTQKVNRFEKRALEFDGDPDEFVTEDKKLIYVDTFARWRISDPRTFLKAVATEVGAQTRLDDIIDSASRTVIANHRLIEAVRNSDTALTEDPDILEARQQLDRERAAALADTKEREGDTDEIVPDVVGQVIEKGREKICADILTRARQDVGEYGIELLDVQIKRINYIQEVERRVIERMMSDRQQIAEMLRSEGEEKRQSLLGEIEREKNKIMSEAYRQGEEIRGEAEAEAARVYAETYGRDPEFYTFWKTLELYRETLGANTTLVIGTGSDLFRTLRTQGVVTGTTATAGAEREGPKGD